jgi:hypothetical protein
MKSPPRQYTDDLAYELMEAFVAGISADKLLNGHHALETALTRRMQA